MCRIPQARRFSKNRVSRQGQPREQAQTFGEQLQRRETGYSKDCARAPSAGGGTLADTCLEQVLKLPRLEKPTSMQTSVTEYLPVARSRLVNRGRKTRGSEHVMQTRPMAHFYLRGILANLITLTILLACLFIPAGTIDYWQAWVFVAVFGVSSQALGVYFLAHDRKLVERRMNIGPVAEQRPAQKFISALFILGFVGFVVLPAFDHRFDWSPVAPVVSVIADAMIVLSFLLFFVVMKSNSYAASTIQVENGQPVVSTGPYAYVRHPMYSGALLLLAAMPLALGSWRSVLLILPFFPILVWRILDEEMFLRKNLPGYAEYMQRVRYRLVPQLW